MNGDGIEDFAINRFDRNTLEVFYGGTSIRSTPDVTLNGDFTWTDSQGNKGTTVALNVVGADFNDDGFSDIIVVQQTFAIVT
ncbi:MAG: hypothetical protein U5J63_13070 [Fodinibius sp.]|nr:hypothetical protein [Fodinibius sp.]